MTTDGFWTYFFVAVWLKKRVYAIKPYYYKFLTNHRTSITCKNGFYSMRKSQPTGADQIRRQVRLSNPECRYYFFFSKTASKTSSSRCVGARRAVNKPNSSNLIIFAYQRPFFISAAICLVRNSKLILSFSLKNIFFFAIFVVNKKSISSVDETPRDAALASPARLFSLGSGCGGISP